MGIYKLGIFSFQVWNFGFILICDDQWVELLFWLMFWVNCFNWWVGSLGIVCNPNVAFSLLLTKEDEIERMVLVGSHTLLANFTEHLLRFSFGGGCGGDGGGCWWIWFLVLFYHWCSCGGEFLIEKI